MAIAENIREFLSGSTDNVEKIEQDLELSFKKILGQLSDSSAEK